MGAGTGARGGVGAGQGRQGAKGREGKGRVRVG